jgi:hypothetical protein
MDDGLGRLARSGEGVRHRGFVGHSSGPCQAAPGRGHTGLRTGEPRAGLCRLEGLAEHEGGGGGSRAWWDCHPRSRKASLCKGHGWGAKPPWPLGQRAVHPQGRFRL